MKKKLRATCDRILARLPIQTGDANIVGGIIIPMNVKLKDAKPIVELVIESAGPDCKVARAGLKVIVNKNVCAPLEIDGVEWMVFSEVTAIAIVEEVEEQATPRPDMGPVPLTMEEIKTGLGIPSKPIDDSSAVPVTNGA